MSLTKLSDRELKRLLRHSYKPKTVRSVKGRHTGFRSRAYWTNEEEALLRIKPVAVVAKMTGRSVSAVQVRKVLLGLTPHLKPWTAKDERLLGTRPDHEVARMLKRSSYNVAWRRNKLGIPCFYCHRPWSKSQLKLLGVKTDEEVARKTGHPLKAVRAKRQQLGRQKPDQIMHFWTEAEDRLVGVLPDAEVARCTGRAVLSVLKRRHRLQRPNPCPPYPRWTQSEIALLGTMPDLELASHLNCKKARRTSEMRWESRLSNLRHKPGRRQGKFSSERYSAALDVYGLQT